MHQLDLKIPTQQYFCDKENKLSLSDRGNKKTTTHSWIKDKKVTELDMKRNFMSKRSLLLKACLWFHISPTLDRNNTKWNPCVHLTFNWALHEWFRVPSHLRLWSKTRKCFFSDPVHLDMLCTQQLRCDVEENNWAEVAWKRRSRLHPIWTLKQLFCSQNTTDTGTRTDFLDSCCLATGANRSLVNMDDVVS